MRECGRSMVEMLGVLAIIGVLSVGAIVGYSKAMMKYKLNKQAEQISQLLASIFTTISQNSYSVRPDGTRVAELFNKLKLLPDGMIYMNPTVVKDSMNDRIELYVRAGENNLFFIVNYYNKHSSTIDSCVNIFEILKEYSYGNSTLDQVFLLSTANDYYFRKLCKNVNPCLSNMNTTDFYIACEKSYQAFADGKSGHFQQWAVFKI